MKPKSYSKSLFSHAVTASFSWLRIGALAFSISHASANDGTWLGVSGNWSAPETWTSGIIPNGAGFTANFTGVNITAGQTVTVDTARTIGNLAFIDAVTSSNSLTLDGLGPLTLEVAEGAPQIDVANQTLILSTDLAGTKGFTKTGAGQLRLSGANPDLSGPVTIATGVLSLGNTAGLGGATSLSLAANTRLLPVVDGATVEPPITIGEAGTTTTINAPVTTGTGGVIHNLTLNGAISGDGDVRFWGTSGSNIYGMVTLGAASTYKGSTLLTTDAANSNKNIFVTLGAPNALPATTVLTIDGNTGTGSGRFAVVEMDGNSQTLAGLVSVSRNLRVQRIGNNVDRDAAVLTLNTTGNFSYAGTIGGVGPSGITRNNVSLVKTGPGSQTLSGINAFTGTTTINEGKLIGVTGGNCAASSVTVATTAATLGVSVTDNAKTWSCANLTTAAAGTLEFDFGTTGPSDTTAPLVVNGTADFTVTPLVVVRGNSLATLPVGSHPLMTWTDLSGTAPTAVILPPTMEGNLTVSGQSLVLNITKASTLPIYWATGNGTWDINTSVNWKDSGALPITYQQNQAGSASVVFDDFDSGPGPNLAITLPADVTPADVKFDHSSKNFSVSGAGGITGATALLKNGTGTLTLATPNTYSGVTTISAGTLKLGAADVVPDGTGRGNLIVDGTLDLSGFSETINGLIGFGTVDTTASGSPVLTVGNATATFDGIIQNTSGSLALVKAGTGTQTLNGESTYSGGTSITGGVVVANHASALGTGAVQVDGGTRLVVDTELTLANPITLGTNVGVAGRGLIEAGTIAGTTTLTGPITITQSPTAGGHFAAPTAGTALHVTGQITSSVPVAQRAGTVAYSGGGTGFTDLTLFEGTLLIGANDGLPTATSLTMGPSGNSTLDLNGFNQTFAGITRSSTPTARIGNSSTTSDSTLTLTGTSSFSGEITDVLGDGTMKVNLAKTTGGITTLSGANTYTGTTTITGGTLAIAGNNVLPNDSAITLGNGALAIGDGFTDLLGTLEVTGNATIQLGTGAVLEFNTGSPAWSGSLTITGAFTSGASLRFGTDANGLTAPQLASISAPGFTGFALNAEGFLTATPGGSGFSLWQAANGTAGGLSEDHDSDGVSNGVEYFIGGPSGTTTGFTPLPGVAESGGLLSVTWTKAAGYAGAYGSDFVVETSTTLSGPWTQETLGGTVQITGNTVKYTFPAGTKNFARLKVTGP